LAVFEEAFLLLFDDAFVGRLLLLLFN
jgi:hypothetical protein